MASPPSLANAELGVMEVLWERPSQTARELRERLYPEGKGAHGTVQRLLQRLEDKGFVRRRREEGIYRYAALLSREEYAGLQLEQLAAKLTGGSVAPLLTHLLEADKLPRDEIARIRGMLDAHVGDPEADR